MKTEPKTLALVPAEKVGGLAPAGPVTVLDMIQAIVKPGTTITSDMALALKELAAMQERQEDRSALRQYMVAFKKLQSELPHIEVNKAVPTKSGTTKFRYATPQSIMTKVEKPLADNGFSVKFSQRAENGYVTAICTLIHEGGHREDSEYSVHSAAPYDGSGADADVASSTKAMREALCFALKLVRLKDDAIDPTKSGPPISKAQAKDLEKRVNESGSDVERFLKFAGAESFDKISSSRYAELDAELRRKEDTTK